MLLPVMHLLWILIKREITSRLLLSQFGYCPLIWIFLSIGLNDKINRFQRALSITFNDKLSTISEFFNKDSSVALRYGNIRALAIET